MPEWFLVEYACQGGFSEGGRPLAFSWLHNRLEAVSCHILNIRIKKKILNSHRAGYGYFKDGSPENSDLFHCSKAVAFSNDKYNNNYNNYMEILEHVAISKNY